MTRRSMATRSYGMPLLALALNVSWEIIYATYVTETLPERIGFAGWLLLDVGLVYTTVKFAPHDWETTSPTVGSHVRWILAALTALGCVGHYAFAAWWLSAPGVGSGDKAGKWWHGNEFYDITELSFWSAGASQLALSAGSFAMLLVRGHSGGVGYRIWACRFIGTAAGLYGNSGLLWYYWPEAHGYFVNPFGVFICATSFCLDALYPFVLWHVRKSERTLPDGRLIRGEAAALSKKTR